MKYEQPELKFIRLAMNQDVITTSSENDELINKGQDGIGDSSDIGGVL